MEQRPKYFRSLFSSFWLPYVYDFWVYVAVLGQTKALRENILEFVPKTSKVIVDLATGTGENAIVLKRAFPNTKVFASDLSLGMLGVAKKKANKLNLKINFSLQDAAKTQYPKNFADFISISFALHDLPRQQRLEVMKEAHRILKPKGRLAIYDYHFPKTWLFSIPLIIQCLLVENLDAWRMFKEDLFKHLQNLGFKNVQKKTYFKGLAQIVVGEK